MKVKDRRGISTASKFAFFRYLNNSDKKIVRLEINVFIILLIM